MTVFMTRPPICSGVPLGGLGTGSIELRPDGEFHSWQIANPLRFRQDCRKKPDADDGENLTGSLSFCLRTEEEDKILLRRLGFGTGDNNFRMYSFLKPVSFIEFKGSFPVAKVSYRDDSLPVEISLEAAAPFTPYEENTAGMPGIFLTFSIHNRSEKTVSVSLAGKLKTIVSAETGDRRCRVLKDGSFTGILSESSPEAPDAPDRGSIVLSAAGSDISFLSGEYRRYMDEYVAHGPLGVSEESYLFDLYRAGRLPDIAHSSRIDSALLSVNPDALSDEEVCSLFDAFTEYASAASITDRLKSGAKEQMLDSGFLREVLRYLLKNLRESDDGQWGDSALCVHETLSPGATVEVPFLLSWYFPSLYSSSGAFVGHRYAADFSDASEVTFYLWQHRQQILLKVHDFCDVLYDTGFPEVFSDAVSIHLSTLVKSSWWAKNGDFGIWEGLGSCGLHTTDIAYHGTFGICALFPRLQQRQMRMTASRMRSDGAVPHFFSPDFSAVDEGFERVDMNPQFVLLVCRDWLATGDLPQLRELFPAVCAAMNRTESLDLNGDGLPDTETGRNTYDAWKFSGTPAYVSILWLASLKAAARLADDLGETELARKWRMLLQRGTDSILQLLWNGSCFDLWNDGEQKDECCMTDQLDGECFCRLIGLGGIFDDQIINKALDTIWHANFSPERGLINAGCLPQGKTTLYTFRNCQGEANWSGIEYWFAAYLLMTGSYERGLQLVKTVQERYERLGLVWNHAECGDFYYRPLSSFALLNALSGFSYDAPAQTLRFGPASGESFHIPWFASSGYGILSGTSDSRELTVCCGTLTVRRLLLRNHSSALSLFCGGKPLPFTLLETPEELAVRFEPVILKKGQKLSLSGKSL
ncbi:MAG: hypothetical protein IKF49_02175 [Clostridia bacterium]|nr:hypothetical protein [Clostridia bacterium]